MFETKLFHHGIFGFVMAWFFFTLIGIAKSNLFPLYWSPVAVVILYLSFKFNGLVHVVDDEGVIIKFSYLKKRIKFSEIEEIKTSDIIDFYCPKDVLGFYMRTISNRRYVVLYEKDSNSYKTIKETVESLKT